MADFPMTPWQDLGYWQKRKKDKWRRVVGPVCTVPVIDTHCHLNSLSDPVFALARAACLGVEGLCTIVDPAEKDDTFALLDNWIARSKVKAEELMAESGLMPLPAVGASVTQDEQLLLREGFSVALASEDELPQVESQPWVRIGVGCHPHNAQLYDEALESRIADLAKDSRVSVLGEIGLDYHYDLSPRDVQKDCFRRQIRLAKTLDLPIALHVREAHDDAFSILEEEGFPSRGVLLHCCSLSPEEIRPWVDAGCWIAYGGPLTFTNADYAREGACLVPIDRLLTETDSPYMTPVPLRGVECYPDYVGFTAQRLSSIVSEEKGVSQEEALRAFAQNARAFLGIDA